jgi:hypothetical protein
VNFQPIHVERCSKQCASVHVNEMAARQIATIRAATHQGFPAVISQRHHFDVGRVERDLRRPAARSIPVVRDLLHASSRMSGVFTFPHHPVPAISRIIFRSNALIIWSMTRDMASAESEWYRLYLSRQDVDSELDLL